MATSNSQVLSNFFNKISSFLFYTVILSIPFQKRFFFESPFSFLENHFIEYNSYYISSPEIIILLLLLLNYEKILKNILFKKSRTSSLFFLILTSTLFLSFVKSTQPLFFIHKIFHLTIWVSFIFYGIQEIVTYQKLIKVIQISILAALGQSIIAIIQFINQSSIGLEILGESHLLPTILGVAKINFNNLKIIRAYGTEPHPNILGSYLFMNLIFILFYLINITKIKGSILNFIVNLNCSTWNNLKLSLYKIKTSIKKIVPRGTIFSSITPRLFHVEQSRKSPFKHSFFQPQKAQKETYLFLIVLIFLIIALFVTFSRTNLVLFIAFLFLVRLFHVEQSRILNKIILISFCLIITLSFIFSPLLKSRLNEKGTIENKNIILRNYYNQIASKTITEHPLLGIGAGSFVFNIPKISNIELEPWELQPVHNIYLLIASELGFIILSLFLLVILLSLFHSKRSGSLLSTTSLKLGLFLILISGLTDHYLYSFSQGNAILALLLLVLLSSMKINSQLFHVEQFKLKQKKEAYNQHDIFEP